MKKIFFTLFLFLFVSVSAKNNSDYFEELFDSSIPEKTEEIKYYDNSKTFLQKYGYTCEIASDGCNTIQIEYGRLGVSTKIYCDETYGPKGKEKWSCLKEFGELNEEDEKLYYSLRFKISKKYRDQIDIFLSKYKYKLYLITDLDIKREKNDTVISKIETKISKIKDIYKNKVLPKKVNDVNMILTLLKLELMKIK